MATAPQAFRRFPAAVSGFTGRLHLLSHAQPCNDQMSKQWRNTCGFQRFLYNSTWLLWWDSKTWWLNRPAWNWNMEGGDKHGQQWSKKRGDPPKWVKIGISHSEKFGTGKGEEWHLLRCQLSTMACSPGSPHHPTDYILIFEFTACSMRLLCLFLEFVCLICADATT